MPPAVATPKAEKSAKSPKNGKAASPASDLARRARSAAMLLKQVSDPNRLQILLILAEQERNVGAICVALGNQSQPAISHHLALLRHGRLIEPRRDGKNNIYSPTDEGRRLVEAVRSLVG